MATTKPAVKQELAVVPFVESSVAPAWIQQGPARGSEEVTSKDMVLPRLEIVQALSPIKETNPDAREGLLFNSVTQQIYGDLVYFVPVYYRMEYLVWKLQNEGGGFFGAHESEGAAQSRLNEVVEDGEDRENLEIVDTPVQYGLLVTPEGVTEQIVISMAKTKAKVSRKWNAMIQIAGGDRFSRVYKLTSFNDENKKGQKFKNFVVQAAGFTPEAVYRQAEALYEVLKTQDIRVAHETVVNADGGADRGGI